MIVGKIKLWQVALIGWATVFWMVFTGMSIEWYYAPLLVFLFLERAFAQLGLRAASAIIQEASKEIQSLRRRA